MHVLSKHQFYATENLLSSHVDDFLLMQVRHSSITESHMVSSAVSRIEAESSIDHADITTAADEPCEAPTAVDVNNNMYIALPNTSLLLAPNQDDIFKMLTQMGKTYDLNTLNYHVYLRKNVMPLSPGLESFNRPTTTVMPQVMYLRPTQSSPPTWMLTSTRYLKSLWVIKLLRVLRSSLPMSKIRIKFKQPRSYKVLCFDCP